MFHVQDFTLLDHRTACVTEVGFEHHCCLCQCLWLGCVAQVPPTRGKVFVVDPIREPRGRLLLRHVGRDHHTVSRLEGRKEKRLFSLAAAQFLCRLSLSPAAEQLVPTEVTVWRVTYLPVSRCWYFFRRCDLEGVHHAQNLIKVASGGGRVEKGQFQLFVRADDKHLQGQRDAAWRG